MTRPDPNGAANPNPATNPQSPGSVLPASYRPSVAAYAPGPWLDPRVVIPTGLLWMDARVYRVENADGWTYHALRITQAQNPDQIGYWSIELLGATH